MNEVIDAISKVCFPAAWDVSHAYVPYCPTLPELYQMILGMQ